MVKKRDIKSNIWYVATYILKKEKLKIRDRNQIKIDRG